MPSCGAETHLFFSHETIDASDTSASRTWGPCRPASPKDSIRSELRGPQRARRSAWATRWQVGRKPRTSIFLSSLRLVWHWTNPHVARSRWFKPDSEWYFFSGGPPCLGNGVQTPTKSTFPGVCDLAPKARKTFFYESSESESALFCISPSPGYLCGPYFKVTARTNNGNPAVLFSQRYKPHLANWGGGAPE